MKNNGIDLSYIGKDSFNINILQLKNDRKLLKIYSNNIQSFINSIDDNKKILKKLMKEIDKYSPMDHYFSFLKKFQIIINFYYLYTNNLLEKSQQSIEHLKVSIDSNLTFITEFLSNIQEIADNIKLKSDFISKQNDLILNCFQDTENAIVQDYLKLNNKIDKKTAKNDKKSKDQLINDCHKNESDFKSLSLDINDMIKDYKMKYNTKMKEIKNKMIELSQTTKSDIINIIQIIKDGLNNLITKSDNEIQNLQNSDVNNQEKEQSLSKYLKFHIEDDELKDLIKPKKYKLNIIRNNQIQLSNKNYFYLTKKDIYNIVELIYSYDFDMIDKTEYNMTIEKNILEIIQKAGKILGYDFNKEVNSKKEIFSNEEITNYINYILSKEEYLIEFLVCLNQFRTKGNFELKEDLFNMLKIIFCKASDYLLEHKTKKIYYLLIILSQTFYKINENEKYFLQSEIKDKEFFLQDKFWIELLEDFINEELRIIDENIKKNNIIPENRNSKIEEIILSKLVSLMPSFNNFNISNESKNFIVLSILKKYNINEEKKQYFLSILDTFKD